MQLGRWQRTAVYTTATAVAGSGLIWFIAHDLIEESGDLTRSLLTLHGAASYALLVVLGSLLPIHVRWGWRHRRNVLTGVPTLATMAILAVTALMLYYGSEETHTPARWVHIAIGVLVSVLLPAHAFCRSKPTRGT